MESLSCFIPEGALGVQCLSAIVKTPHFVVQ